MSNTLSLNNIFRVGIRDPCFSQDFLLNCLHLKVTFSEALKGHSSSVDKVLDYGHGVFLGSSFHPQAT